MSETDRSANAAAFFDGARLTMARHLAGLRKSDLAALIKKSPTAVSAWETGAKRPTPSTVAQLALGLSVDPGFFAARPNDVAKVSALPHFRSLRSTSQLARDQAFAYGQIALDIAESLERHVEFPDVDLLSRPVDMSVAATFRDSRKHVITGGAKFTKGGPKFHGLSPERETREPNRVSLYERRWIDGDHQSS